MYQAQMKINTKIGELYLVASSNGLQGLYFSEQNAPYLKDKNNSCAAILKQTAQELAEYFDGTRQDFAVPLEIIGGTPFQRKVWQQLTKIKYGETCSYQDLAAAVGNKKACRAVGSANGKNPISIIIPCHRVIATDKTLGGYAGGLNRKSVLLGIEK
jgi:methylated-DNA-[protein]-cysteine S-methyltransferase